MPTVHPLPLAAVRALPGLLETPTDAVKAWLAERGQPAHRLRQLRRWLLVAGAESFDDMTDLPRALRQELVEAFAPLGNRVLKHLSADDGTHKLLVGLRDQKSVECVLIQEADRRTACISTQVGCGMGCVFCASGLNGVERNLTTGEILEQLIRLRNLPTYDAGRRRHLEQSGERVDRLTHIVVMGMGEPLANLDNLLAALDVATAKDGLGIGARHITISTVGLPAKIRQLADLGKQYHLAVSLHAPQDDLRTQIVPTNDKVGLPSILAAADYFLETTGRQVTYEYVLLGGMNDGPDHAQALARLLHGRGAHVNLIPFNDVAGLPYRRPSDAAITGFQEALQRGGVSVKVRKRKGAQIDAACGQLRRSSLAEEMKNEERTMKNKEPIPEILI
jgi:23S rRNA (adenine2503-C2)-methyltransferase